MLDTCPLAFVVARYRRAHEWFTDALCMHAQLDANCLDAINPFMNSYVVYKWHYIQLAWPKIKFRHHCSKTRTKYDHTHLNHLNHLVSSQLPTCLWFHTWGLYIDFYCTMSPHHVGTTIFLTSLRRFFVCPKTLNPNR